MNSSGITFKYSGLILEWLTIMNSVIILMNILSLPEAKFINELSTVQGECRMIG